MAQSAIPSLVGPENSSFFTRRSIRLFGSWLRDGSIVQSVDDQALPFLSRSAGLFDSDSNQVAQFYKNYAENDGRLELRKVVEEKAIKYNIDPPTIDKLHSGYPLDAMPKLFEANKSLYLLGELQEAWINYGVVILKNVLDDCAIDSYLGLREREGCKLGGSSFSQFAEIRNLFCNPVMNHVIHLLTGGSVALYIVFPHSLKSTERPWHQDQYLIEDSIYGSSVSAWVALGDVSEDQGPFQFIPGSHRFGILDYKKVQRYLSDDCLINSSRGHMWTSYTHLLTSQAYSRLLLSGEVKSYSFTPEKGDILISHPRLIHRAALASGNRRRAGIIGQWTTFDSSLASGNLQRDSPDTGWYWS